MRQGKVLTVLFGVFLVLALTAGSVSATIIHVPGDYPQVQLAINAASSGDTVQVAAGRYAPSTNGEAFSINMKNGVRLLGAGAEVCTLDAEGTDGVMYCSGTNDTATRIEGFTITNGSAADGSGILCQHDSDLMITNNIITGNSAVNYGGGIYCRFYSDPPIINNAIADNSAGWYGGGVYCRDESDPVITSNVISENRAEVLGGGIYCDDSSPTIADNTISENSVVHFQGGGIYSRGHSDPIISNNLMTGNSSEAGGGICSYSPSEPTITHNIITDNIALHGGGGILCWGSDANATITNNVISGNSITRGVGGGIVCSEADHPIISNNIISQNSARDDGGGIWCGLSSPTIANNIIAGNSVTRFRGGGICCYHYSNPAITNNVIVGNTVSYQGGGIYCHHYSDPPITNNIITGNSAGNEGGGIGCYYYSNPAITRDDVWGNTPSDYYGCSPGTGCISDDPLFVDASAGDYHLQWNSPCIDTGDNNAPGLPEFDFDGNPRIMDGDGDGIAVVDMGAFEYKIPGLLVTGGGWIPARSDGSGGRGTFGFNAHSEGSVVWGQLQFNDHATRMKVHSETVETLAIHEGDTVANFSGDCQVDGVSGYTFECEVEDRGEPGHGVDKFSIDICDGQRNPYYSAGGVLGGGNIQIHKGDDGIAKGESDPGVEPGDDPNPPPSTQGETFVPLAGKGLLQNHPNPFTHRTTVTYHLAPRHGDTEKRRHADVLTYQRINLSIYDLAGRLVRTLVNRTQTAGQYAVDWDGKDSSGRKVATGIYVYQLTARDTEGPPETRRTSRQADDFSRTEKMVILR